MEIDKINERLKQVSRNYEFLRKKAYDAQYDSYIHEAVRPAAVVWERAEEDKVYANLRYLQGIMDGIKPKEWHQVAGGWYEKD